MICIHALDCIENACTAEIMIVHNRLEDVSQSLLSGMEGLLRRSRSMELNQTSAGSSLFTSKKSSHGSSLCLEVEQAWALCKTTPELSAVQLGML